MKILVGTTGDFQLYNGGELVRAEGYSVISPSHFMQSRASIGQIKVVAELSDDATDAEWLNYVRECPGDLDLAVESFRSAFPAGGKVAPAPEVKTTPVAKKPETSKK